ncbi:MAG: sulfatase [Thermoanaerobaculia bacterium]
MKLAALVPLLAVAGWTVACRAPAPVPAERIELAAFAAALRTTVEHGVVDPGEPTARAALGEGWGAPEEGDGRRFAWGVGPQSRFTFELVAARALELRLRGWSFPFGDGGDQRVAVRVNGEPVGEAVVGPAPSELRFAVAAGLVMAGENVVELRYARWNVRAGEQPLAAAWDRVRVVAVDRGGRRSPETPGSPRIDAAAGTIALPAGTALDAALELPAGSRLAWEGLERTGDARLTLAVASGDEPERRSAWSGGSGEALLVDPARPAGFASFALRVAGTNGAVVLRGVHLLRPEEAAPPPPVATLAPAPPPTPAAAVAGKRPNLIIYLVDTLRADHLGCYGYPRPTSPRIDRFAAEAVLFENGRAQSSWTKPAVAAVLTGLYPVAHGAELRAERIHESVETLAERLQAAGYETALFTTNANVSAHFGFAQGWDSFRFLTRREGKKRKHYTAAEMNVEIFAWLAERERRHPARPLFLFVHTLDPHDPYRPSEEFRRRFAPGVDVEAACCKRSNELAALSGALASSQAADAMALYDGEIAQNDAAFGVFLDELERRGLAAASAVLFTADHGEEFFDHGGWKHGFTLYEEMLHIPFVLRLPAGRGAGRTIATAVDQVDIAPTLLALAGGRPGPDLPGRDLRALIDDAAEPPPAFPTRVSFAWLARPGARTVSEVAGAWKLVRHNGPGLLQEPRRTLFDLGADPREQRNLYDPARRPPARARWLEGALAAALAAHGGGLPAEEAEIDPELEKSLRALGYF